MRNRLLKNNSACPQHVRIFCYADVMDKEPSALSDWTPEQIALGRRWVETWKLAGAELERIRRQELRRLDSFRSIALLCGQADYTCPPRAPRPYSGLVEQQRWFMKAAGHD
jgi:hypothetical protein